MTDTTGGVDPPEETAEERELREQAEALRAQRRAAEEEANSNPPTVPSAEQVGAVIEKLKAMAPMGVLRPPADEFLSRLSPEDFETLVAHGFHDARGIDQLESTVRGFLRDERGYPPTQAALFKTATIRREVSRLNHRWRPRGGNVQQVAFPQHQHTETNDDSPFLNAGTYPTAGLIAAFRPGYALSRLGSNSVVVEKLDSGKLRYFTYKQFDEHYADVKVTIPLQQGFKIEPGPRWWIESGQGKTYRNGIDCAPRKLLDRHTLNTWRGFGPVLQGFRGYDLPDDLKALLDAGHGRRGSTTMPRPAGSWRKFRRMVREVICNGDEGLYQFTLNWLAHMVQNPNQPGETFLVLTGAEGIGKGIFGKIFRALLGAHSLYINSSKALTGDFNDHLEGVVALFADEAVFSGSHEVDNILKSLVTEDVISMHRKNYSRYTMRNLLHIIVATNNEWAVRVSATARRPVIYKVSDRHINDQDYFGEITSEMYEQGGLECMLFDLLVRDIRGVNMRKNYITDAMADQREFSFQPHEAWLQDILERGYVLQSRWGLPEFEAWRNVVPRKLLYASYLAYYALNGRRAAGAFGQRKLSAWLLDLGFSEGQSKRSDPVGERMIPNTSTGEVVLCGQENRLAIDLGEQVTARAVFDAKVRRVVPSAQFWASGERSTATRPVTSDGQVEMGFTRSEEPDASYSEIPE